MQTLVASVRILALAVWLGGLVALGAIAAPLVFGHVPAPFSADAMTLVFRRFDRFAVASGVVLLVCDGVSAWIGNRATRLDVVRMGCTVLATLLASLEAAWLSPAISSLHSSGAVRGMGRTGIALEEFHRWAEAVAKGELVLLVVIVVLTALTSRSSAPDRVR